MANNLNNLPYHSIGENEIADLGVRAIVPLIAQKDHADSYASLRFVACVY